MNQKGFTLIELLAVVVILLAISVMAISSISAAIERNKAKQNDTKKAVIISIAELYYNEHRNTMHTHNCIAVSDLPLSEKEREDADGNAFTGYIKYEFEQNSTNAKNFTYQDNSDGCY